MKLYDSLYPEGREMHCSESIEETVLGIVPRLLIWLMLVRLQCVFVAILSRSAVAVIVKENHP